MFIPWCRCFTFCNEVDSYLIKWSVGDLYHFNRIILSLGLLSATKHAICNIFLNILVHTLPVILSFFKQYVHVLPWSPNLPWASTSTVYFQDLGMTRARNFCPESIMCLYKNPLTWVKISFLCCSAFPLSNCLDMHLQNWSVFCIWNRACLL